MVQGEKRVLKTKEKVHSELQYMRSRKRRTETAALSYCKKDILQVSGKIDADGNVLTIQENVLKRWTEYFKS